MPKGKPNIKYRVYHYYPHELFRQYKYDHIDFTDKDKALQHFRKARSATHIRVIRGSKVAEQLNTRTGGLM